MKSLVRACGPVGQNTAWAQCILGSGDTCRRVEPVICSFGQTVGAIVDIQCDNIKAGTAFTQQFCHITHMNPGTRIVKRVFTAFTQRSTVPVHNLGNQLSNGHLGPRPHNRQHSSQCEPHSEAADHDSFHGTTTARSEASDDEAPHPSPDTETQRGESDAGKIALDRYSEAECEVCGDR